MPRDRDRQAVQLDASAQRLSPGPFYELLLGTGVPEFSGVQFQLEVASEASRSISP